MKVLLADINGLLHTMNGVGGAVGFGNPHAAEDVIDLTHADHVQSIILHGVQDSLPCRRYCIIVPIAGADEFTLFSPHIRSGDHTPNTPLILHSQFSGNLTTAVEIHQVEGLLIAADLHDRVCRGVHDHGSGLDLLLTQFFDNGRAAGALVANDPLPAALFQFPDQFLREAGLRKCVEWLFGQNAHHFPMAGHGILAVAGLSKSRISGQRSLHRLYIPCRMEIQHSQLLQIRDIQCPHPVKNMTEGIHIHISEPCGVGHCPNSQGIQHDYKDSMILFHSLYLLSIVLLAARIIRSEA